MTTNWKGSKKNPPKIEKKIEKGAKNYEEYKRRANKIQKIEKNGQKLRRIQKTDK